MRISTLPLLLAIAWPATVSAQAMVQALPGSSDADLLAATMRRVAANPLDLDALLTAGEQSLKVDDLAGAASLFARAEKIDPRSGRVKAGMASILVRSERPGEALRYFAQAEAAGLDPRRFAADRGFAYDLTGDQARAQANYRTAIATSGADDEVLRRYALSLGISGQGEEALRQLQPLLGRSDRAAWRARAFILAMTGDQAGAEKIAATMMPGGMAQGLRPFFERLPALPAVDRAFAVHFGEVRPTPERIADARLAPVLAPLPAAAPIVQVAAVQTRVRAETSSERRRRERNERRAARERVALASRPGRVTLPATSLPAAAAVVTQPIQVAGLAAARSVPVPVAAQPTVTATQPRATITGVAAPVTSAVAAAAVIAPMVQPPIAGSAVGSGVVQPGFSQPVTLAAAPMTPAPTSSGSGAVQPGFGQPVTLAAASVSAPQAAGESGYAPLVVAARSVTQPVTGVVPRPSPPADTGVALAAVGGSSSRAGPITSPAAARTTAQSAPPRTPTADSVLARIVASLSIPAAELGVVAPVRAQPVAAATTEGAARAAEALRTKAARDAEAEVAAQRLVRGHAADARGRTRAGAASAERATADASARRGRGGAAVEMGEGADVVDAGTTRRRGRRGAAPDAREAVELAAADTKASARPTRGGRRGTAVDPADAETEAKRADAKTTRADRKAAAEKKAAADKAAAEKRVATTHPSRIWVQVAGGAYAGDLPKAWAATKAKAPDAFAGRSAYSAKLRATNRVVTGPFKTDAEARAFVNKLAKSGVSAFPFTSDAGETVTRLPAK